MTPAQKFKETKAESKLKYQKQIESKAHFSLWEYSMSLKFEAQAYREMIASGYYTEKTLRSVRFSWEE